MTTAEKKERYRQQQREREAARREALGLAPYDPNPKPAKRRANRPVYGSQEWAETYRDDLGESPDY